MFSIADFLDRAKARGSIESDYRLAKVIGKSHQLISGYRLGKSLPDEVVIEQLCALSGDDPDLIAAQIQAARSKDGPARAMWARIADRLASDRRKAARGVETALLSVLFAIGFIAISPLPVRADTQELQIIGRLDFLHIVSTGVFVSLERLRWRTKGFPGLLRLCWLAWR